MSVITDTVRSHLCGYFEQSNPDTAQLTFLGADALTLLRFGPDTDSVVTYATLGCSANPMHDPADFMPDPHSGPRAELILPLRGGLDEAIRPLAMLAASPSVEGLVLQPGALLDFAAPLWTDSRFTGFVLADADIPNVPISHLDGVDASAEEVQILHAIPASGNEFALARAKGAAGLHQAWQAQGADVSDPHRASVV
ncbi:suppressor of fused domain protein [Corynebacterium sp. TAE3-ERU12]|uniref:suppressor of fused domain protein n=1 Tax=Corynebacterium sp. TAE3-ERU12 TaxID=2849491 RepID=UPI001C48140D|nr:suppressor of fused domain protein [Corynebacterium sp. TAE3-ERU12]MBV7295038.1 suppressor of fused domain protein [Corynebacterium sp. TAE3-ERU12]